MFELLPGNTAVWRVINVGDVFEGCLTCLLGQDITPIVNGIGCQDVLRGDIVRFED